MLAGIGRRAPLYGQMACSDMIQSRDSKGGGSPPKGRSRGFGWAFLLLLVAASAFGLYRVVTRSGEALRAQETSVHESATFFNVQGSRFTVPEGSPLRTQLEIAPVVAQNIERSLVLPAVVEADPARTVKVLPPVTGRVVDLKVQLGGRVAQGDVLAIIDSSDLGQALSDDEKASAALTLTKQALDRLVVLEKSSAVAVKDREQAQSDYAQAKSEYERTQARLKTIGISADQAKDTRLLPLKAPVAGSIIDLEIGQGSYINDVTANVMTIADLANVWVTADVPEKDTALVTTGQSADVVFTAYPNEVFKGQTQFVSDILDPDTRRTKVRIDFANPNRRFKPNMFANTTFLARQENVPVVRTTAIVLRNESDQVFVEVEPWVFEPRPVNIAFQQGDLSIVARGLKAGDRVVVKGGVQLND
jgi:membrane fusion protein, heavy metal efflux system